MDANREPSLGPFFVLWTGQALSLLGSQAVQFALIWWLTVETGSAAVLAGAAFVGIVPTVALGPVIGALVDRFDRKRVMLVSDAAVALASVCLAVLFVLDRAHLEAVFVILFVRALGGAFHAPAMMASTSLMVPARHLTRIQGLNQSLQGGMLIVAAPAGALLWTALPMAGVMAVDALTASFALVPLAFLRIPRPPAVDGARAAGVLRSLGPDIARGLRYLRERPGHRSLLGLAVLVNLCMMPAFSLLPLLVERGGGGAVELGLLNAAFGVGTLAGGIALGVWGGFRRRMTTTLTGLVGVGLATLALSAVSFPPLAGALGAIFAVGVMIPVINGPIHALLQTTVAPDLQGRVFTLYGSLCGLAIPLGLALAGPIAELAGVRAWYVAGGLACIAAGATGFLLPSLRTLENGEVFQEHSLGTE